MADDHEVRGVRLGDVYRDKNGDLWEVLSLCTEPTATVVHLGSAHAPGALERETHVIGCLNWTGKWAEGPLRAAGAP